MPALSGAPAGGVVETLRTGWSADPTIVFGLALALAAYVRGRALSPTGRRPSRPTLVMLGAFAILVALVSPLDDLAHDLASAHMVQHVLLTIAAAPLLVLGAPWSTMLRGAPRPLRRRLARASRAPVVRAATAWARRPVAAWVLHTAALWLWHSAVLYDLAVRHDAAHALAHGSLLVTALLLWSVVLRPAEERDTFPGWALVLVFTMGLQSVFLAALLTFAPAPWYDVYATTTEAWGLDQLADQQLAGVIMWVPAGFVYTAAGLALLASWLRRTDGPSSPPPPRRPLSGDAAVGADAPAAAAAPSATAGT